MAAGIAPGFTYSENKTATLARKIMKDHEKIQPVSKKKKDFGNRFTPDMAAKTRAKSTKSILTSRMRQCGRTRNL